MKAEEKWKENCIGSNRRSYGASLSAANLSAFVSRRCSSSSFVLKGSGLAFVEPGRI